MNKKATFWNDARIHRPSLLEKCLVWNKYVKAYRLYVYDDISKYWCDEHTTKHDPDGDNHITDYADYDVTHWMSIPSIDAFKTKNL